MENPCVLLNGARMLVHDCLVLSIAFIIRMREGNFTVSYTD